ncbi:uncharacterized protein LOC102654799 [Apis mellifera]|uniref:Uncharacterized protein LOC102654799 n=1 Tax=Apis mellifera TaxID=7460 RepID=A0A7M7MWM1_APIME|nr:uncharacterized protein LOC102654799 [Apis mellifera]|eukprot:XP_026302097.1 uncharacterized protein LOC102654799 [Apis mellifera]
MCNCHHHRRGCPESESDPSSVLQESWQTPLDESIQSSGEFCSPHCFPSSNPRFPRTPPRTPPRSPLRTPPRTPLSDLTREIPPSAPLRILRERPDLSMGVAIAAHRLDFETLSGYEDMDETDMDETDVSGKFPPFFTSLVLENRENQNFLTDFIPDLPKQENF